MVDEEDQERCRTGAVVPKRVCEWKEGVVKREPLMFHEFRRQKCAFDWLDAQRRSAQEKNLQGCSAGDEIKAAAKKIAPHNWEACAENIRKCYKLNGVVESRDALQSNTSQMGHGASSYCHMMPFSMELKGRDGAWFRRYAAATYSSILSKCKQHARCYFYEVIRDGYPCHMYFDLEYNVEENPSLDGNRMVDSLLLKLDNFLKYVCALFVVLFFLSYRRPFKHFLVCGIISTLSSFVVMGKNTHFCVDNYTSNPLCEQHEVNYWN